MKIWWRLVGTLVMVMTLAGALSAAAQPRPTLAIVDFETTPAGSVLPPPHMGSALAGLMLDRLVASGQYRVLDGRWLKIDRATDGYTTWRRSWSTRSRPESTTWSSDR